MNTIFIVKVFCTLLTLFWLIIMVKIEVSYRHHLRIGDAIYRYNCNLITHDIDAYLHGGSISFEVTEPFANTIFRLWDWGYTRIVDKETFEKIKPYI